MHDVVAIRCRGVVASVDGSCEATLCRGNSIGLDPMKRMVSEDEKMHLGMQGNILPLKESIATISGES